MKKVLAVALAALLTAAFSASAFAASKIDFSGYYKVRYMMDENYLRYDGDDAYGREKDGEDYFNHRLRFNVTIEPTEFIKLNWRFEAPNNARWGRNHSDAGASVGDIQTKYIYADIATEIGTVKVGRIYGLDTYGLSNVGYTPYWGEFINVGAFEDDTEVDGIALVSEWDSFGLKLAYGKRKNTKAAIADNSVWAAVPVYNYPGSTIVRGSDADTYVGPRDQDFDQFVIEPSYKWETGAASMALTYNRDMLDGEDSPAPGTNNNVDNNYAFFVNPAVYNAWNLGSGEFSFHLEGMFGWGKTEYAGGTDQDREGYGFYADVDYNYGPGHVTLAGWYTSGNTNDSDKEKDLVKMGANFYPFVVAYNYNAAGYADATGTEQANIANLGHWAVAIWAEHAFTDEIRGRLAVGYFGSTDDYYKRNWIGDTAVSPLVYQRAVEDKSIGVEVDAGLEFQLMENLTLETSFGYMFNGDYYKAYNPVSNGDDSKPDDTYSWVNCLTIQF